MEKGIGEIFILKGERYMVCEQTAKNVSHCWNCAFRYVSCGALGLGECGRQYRADNKNVFFYKIVDNKENENMNENLDLVEILKDCPVGMKLYSTVHGESKFKGISDGVEPIATESYSRLGIMGVFYTSDGRVDQNSHGECVLFPSKDQRDWSKFEVPVEKFDYSTLKPFDRVLVRDNNMDIWRCSLFTCFDDDRMNCSIKWLQGIPYNDETKHLAGTTDKPDKKYIWWEE